MGTIGLSPVPEEVKVVEVGDTVVDDKVQSVIAAAKVIENSLETIEVKIVDKVDALEKKVKTSAYNLKDQAELFYYTNPEIKATIDKLEAKAVEEVVKAVDGKEFTCWCFAWWVTVKTSRRDPRTSPANTVESK